MQGNARRDTKPELAVRRLLHAQGLRYRIDFQPLPAPRRRADIVFTRQRIAVFIDGCFWHGCSLHGTAPRTNSRYWAQKISTNAARDRDTDLHLARAGWIALRFWEHDDASTVASAVANEVHFRSTQIRASRGAS
jgi:DNA mismatch endonuclease (patch repair protein)